MASQSWDANTALLSQTDFARAFLAIRRADAVNPSDGTLDDFLQITVEDLLAPFSETLQSGYLPYASWTELNAVTASDVPAAQVPDADTGTHTDPISGLTVPNAGTYRLVVGSPAGWLWVFPSVLSEATAATLAAQAAAVEAAASAASIAGVTDQVDFHSLLEADRGGTQYLGRPEGDLGAGGSSGMDAKTYAFANPIENDGALQEVDIFVLSPTPFTLTYAINDLSGHTVTADADSISTITVPGASGSGEWKTVQLFLPNSANQLISLQAPAGCIAYKSATPADGLGYYQSTATGFQSTFTFSSILTTIQLQIRFKQSFSNVNSAMLDQIAGNSLVAALTDASFPKASQTLFNNAQLGNYGPANTFSVFCVAVDSASQLPAGPLDGAQWYLERPLTATTFHLQVWKKSTTDPNIDVTPLNATGTLLVDTTVSAASSGVTAGGYGWIAFPFPEQITLDVGESLFCKVWAIDASSAVVKLDSGFGSTYGSQHQRGWYNTDGTTSLSHVINSSSGAPAVVFTGPRYSASAAGATTISSTRDLVQSCAGSAASLVTTISGTLVRDNAPISFSATVTHSAAATGTATNVTVNRAGTALTLTYASGNPTNYAAASPTGFLPNSNITALALKKVSDGSALTQGTDFVENADHGVLGLLPNAAAYAVSATYNWAKVRYDLIVLNPETMAISIIAGTARDWDVAEYLPKRSASTQIELFYARVVGGAITRLIPRWDVENGVRRSFLPDIAEQSRLNRSALRKTLARLARGTTFPLVGYGDSETAIQSGTPSNTVANGQVRDRATSSGYLGVAQQADTIAAVPLFDFSDGAGQVHTKIGWNWPLQTAMAAYGWAGAYQNMGVAGTTSDTSTGNGRDPTRLAAAVGYAANGLVVLAFGQNELGGANTEANTIAMIQAFQAVGADVIVMGVTRPNTYRGAAGWLNTNRALERAARWCGVAFCSTLNVCGDDQLGVIGLDPIDMSAANLDNHPGIYEMIYVYAAALIRALFGE